VSLEIFKDGWDSSDETLCGYGSELRNTIDVLAGLKDFMSYVGVDASMNDAGCGDLHWIFPIMQEYDYVGYDLYPRRDEVVQCNIVEDVMRKADVILCRDVLIHFPNKLVIPTLQKFSHSKSKYLISTYFPGVNNYERSLECTMHHQKLDLCTGPFFLGEPIGRVPENYKNKFLGIWLLP
jgi:hypothetical protein